MTSTILIFKILLEYDYSSEVKIVDTNNFDTHFLADVTREFNFIKVLNTILQLQKPDGVNEMTL